MNIKGERPLGLSEAVLESAPDSIFAFRDGEIVYVNPAATRLFGFERHELIGQSIDVLFGRESAELIRNDARELPSPAREYRARDRHGAALIVEIILFRTNHQEPQAVVAFARDVSERHRTREQLARADRMAALGILAAGIAHEINNPLAYMALGVEALQRHLERLPVDAQTRQAALALLDPVRIGADRVADIVRELRTVSRSEIEVASAVSLATVIATAERMVAHELRDRTRISVRVEEDPQVLGHAGRLEQVLINLLTNAAQAFTSESVDPQIVITCTERLGVAEIDIEDNGPGIPAHLRARVFDPFFTTKPAGVGTGLGLSICHGIVNRMGGEITIDDSRLGGTRVRVRLPSVSLGESRPVDPSDVTPVQHRDRRLRVLVIDDEPALGRAVQSLLGREHDVFVATSGAEGLERIASGDPLDVVLCDVMMPHLTGAELHARVSLDHPTMARRFVFMTGGAVTKEADAFLKTTLQPCLQKPFTPSELRATLLRIAAP